MPHPALPLLVGAALQGLLPERVRGPAALASALLALASVAMLPEGTSVQVPLAGFELRLVAADRLSLVFGLVFATMACLGTLYALHVRHAGEQAASLVYSGAALGVVFAGDWRSLFVWWELMAVASAVLVWCGGRERSAAAGLRYLLVHLVSGSLLLAGILELSRGAGLELGPVPGGTAYWLLLAGVAVNAAIPPFHAWLTDAYPEASATGSVFLSAFTTKAAVYVLVRAFPGADALALAGVAMALYGVVFAVLENDIRRLLAYHIVSQVGYMVAAVGMGTALALDGAAAHAFSHILYKALLFMGAGAVLVATGRSRLTELGGLASALRPVLLLYMIGAFAISGVPLFSGFVSKSMVVSAASASGFGVIELLLTLASVGTFLHTGLKLPWFTFFATAAPPSTRPVPGNMLLAMAVAAALCVGVGVFPGWLYARLPFGGAGYEPYTVDHVVAAVQLLLGTGVAFVLLRGKLGGEATVSLDTDWLYRRPLLRAAALSVAAARRAGPALERVGGRAVAVSASLARGGPASATAIGRLVLWMVAALGAVTALVRGG
jgi:multicomponent Na+:H+ antiporter subunit D